ncbi:receptor-type tyrosine-protein phosphatase beta-like [Ranitomeya variabilis]|uniref:receptor-type tyrosine-protein phosphatase beta-like n=1 Tax=Ranitomeya variabilis TaxID=490064 RepID=UPI0040571D8B
MNFMSGTQYVIYYGNDTISCCRSVTTNPISVKSLQIGAVTSYSVSLAWSKPDEYQTLYSYRVQTNVTSSASMINNTIVTSESATIMNLTPGETYTFLVYTRAADNSTESDPVSNMTCTVPGQVSSILLNNYQSVDVLGASWIIPAGQVDNYTVSLTGAINITTQTTSTQVNFTGLLPGREYNVTVQTVSGSCSQTSAPVTEATYPTPPGILSFTTITTNNLTLSWLEPVNMTGVNKTYNISYGISPSTNLSVTSPTTSVTTLQSLISGTNYSIAVVTVGVRGYQSSPVTTSVYTKPMSVKSLQIGAVTSYSVSLTWSKPDEYQSSYSYRVQTNVTSSATMINNTIVTSESATIMNLTPGETYTFLVYTRAADNSTESDPVSNTACTVPGQVSSITMNNYQSVYVLGASWIIPAGQVDNYTVSLTGAINNTTQTTSTQVNFTGLLPGREYNVTVQTVSGSCSQTSAPVTEATYPTPPGMLSFTTITTKNMTLSWLEPVNMAGVNKTYNISYEIYPSTTLSVTSPTTRVTLQSLISGTNYSIAVVTVGVRGYQSSPVTTSVYTKPISVKSLQIGAVTSYSASLTWSKPDEYQTSYSYRVQTFNSSATMINNTIVTSESATIINLTPGETYTFLVYTRAADNSTESDPVSNTACTVPGQVSTITMNNYQSVDVLDASWTKSAGQVDNYTVSLTGAINNTTQTTSPQVNFTGLLPGREYNVTVQTVSGSCSQTSAPVTEATYPTPPGTLSFITVTTKNLSLSWLEPVNMTGVNKTYNISYGIYPSTTLSVTIPTTNVTLQSLISGTNYSITVETVGVRGYQSSPVTTSVYTKPTSVKSLQISAVTSYSVSLTWSKPDEYQTSYSYRVQTNVTSSASMINDTIVTSESVTIMNLTPGETYTFLVYTRAADNSTESDPVSNTACTVPGQVSTITMNNHQSVDVLGASWIIPAGQVDNYTVSLTGAINNTTQTTSTQVNFTGLLPGREYNVTVQTVSGSCSQTSAPVTEATYPTPPGILSFIIITTKNLTFSWLEPVNMTGVNKTYNISYGIYPATNLSVTSPTTNVTLQSLISGTNYSITVVTVGVRGYQSSPVTALVYTKPISVKSLQIGAVTSYSASLTWSKPDEYQRSYKYRVQTNVTSSATMINNTIVTSESVTIMNLTPGETYTFLVYTRAADNSTESDPVSNTTCTVPGQVSPITMNNYQSVYVLGASWIKPAGKVDNYTVSLTGAINNTTQTTSTQVNFTGLLPGREYNVTVQTVSGSCSQTSAPVTEATYPTPPGILSFITITTKNLTLSWLEPVNMTGVNKTYNISYRIYPSTNLSVTSPTTSVTTLQSLISGTNYSIAVVTVGARGYQSSPVTTSVYTKPISVKSLLITNLTTYSVSLAWGRPDEYQTLYRYRVQTNVTSSASMINNIIVTNESATIMNLTPGETYTFMVYTRAADNSTESDPVSLLPICTDPTPPRNLAISMVGTKNLTLTWLEPVNMTGVNKTYNISYGISPSTNLSVTSPTTSVTLQSLISGTNYSITVVTVGVRGYQSSPVTTSVYTKPISVKSLQIGAVTSYSVSLTWSKPDEYQTSSRYRVQTNVTSSASMINNTIVTSESATIMNLTPGETYTFMVYTRAADNSTESDPVSNTACTVPGQVSPITINNYQSVYVLGASWIIPAGKVDNYTVSLTGAINNTTQTTSTQVNFTGLLPGREYNVTVQTVSGSCSQTSAPVTEATYPTPPGILSFTTVTTKNLTLSWSVPVNMTGVNKTYNISYGIYPSTNLSVTSPTTNVTLQSLISGTNYSIAVVTVGVRGYQSSPVTTSGYTNPIPVKSLQIGAVTSYSVSLTWSKPDEYQTSYRYRVQTNVTSSASMINNIIVTSESVTIMNLTPGETYTFLVYTRAADNSTESDPVSNTSCTLPGQVSSILLNNYQSVDVLGASWIIPAGQVDNYTVSLTGAINNTTQTTSTQVNFTGLLPGREYNVTVQTVSGSCSQTSAPVTEATYPTPPRDVIFNSFGTNYLTLSWLEPVNMTGSYKFYNISYGISPSTNLSERSLLRNVFLQSLISGTNYSIAVVTVGVRGYQSSPVTTSVYTKPISVKSLQIGAVTSYSVSLTWSKPDEYQTSYSYRVQTNVTSLATMVNNTIVTSESTTIMNLTPGETYTFLVYTRAADNITESDPVSLFPICAGPNQVYITSVENNQSVSSLVVNWSSARAEMDYYNVILSGVIQKISNATTQAIFTGLLPGREYTATVQMVSGNCSLTSASVTSATYPTPPGTLFFITIATKNLTLSWLEPVNMTGVNKTYNIGYGIYPSTTLSVTSPTTSVTLQSLISGTNYSITVVTVGVRGYQSSPVTTSVYTKPMSVKSLQISAVTSYSVSLTWSKPDEYQTSYSYRVQTFNSSATMINDTIVTSESVTIMNLIPGETYTFLVYTRAADISTESVSILSIDHMSLSTCTSLPDQTTNILTGLTTSNGTMHITFSPFDSSYGAIVAYAVIITTKMNGNHPPWGILSKTYSDFKSNLTDTYVTYILVQNVTRRSVRSNELDVQVGDGTKIHSYVNGPLDPKLPYRVSIAGFTDIRYDPNTDTIKEEQSLVSFTNYTDSISLIMTTTTTTTTRNNTLSIIGSVERSNAGTIAGAVIGSLVGLSALTGIVVWFWRKRKHAAKNESYESMFEKLQSNNNKGFIVEFDRLQFVGLSQPRSVALHPSNAEKNHQDASYPYDKSRVKFSTLENSSYGYINASYIPGHKSDILFIAAQHPLPGTIDDFWHMIWEQRITTIVMLSHSTENFQEQGEEYWPKTEVKKCGNILAATVSESNNGGWTVRDIVVSNVKNKKCHQTRQFHFTEWHENGEMDNREALIHFVREVQEYKKENSSNCPTLVHCRTGTVRSGIFIALYCIINQQACGNKVDVYGTVQKMHLHRPLMVETEDQYIFLHHCALDVVKGKKNVNAEEKRQENTEERVYELIPNTFSKVQTQQSEEAYEQTLQI